MLQTYCIVRYTNNARNTVILLLQLLTNDGTTLYIRGLENSASASLLIYSNYALQECSLLSNANIIALIGTVLYNAIKEYYNDRTRKIIYFYSYTVENNYNAIYNYHDNDCRTGYSNKKDIEANEREDKFAILAEEYMIDNCIIHALALIKDE
ncbi:hypothetical protein HBH93_247820 [Parastagonospora nodorum]|nr:hypothetical protein HBH93_247820 [Parastagonospora nodorum]